MFNTTSIQSLEPERQRIAALMAEFEQKNNVQCVPAGATNFRPYTPQNANQRRNEDAKRRYAINSAKSEAKALRKQPAVNQRVARELEVLRAKHDKEMAERRDKFREQCRQREQLRTMVDAL